jgi:hypothetical protein
MIALRLLEAASQEALSFDCTDVDGVANHPIQPQYVDPGQGV